MSRTARVAAQGKINLLLRVLAREASGYHAIETVFLRVTLADGIVVRAGDGVHGRTLDCSGAALPIGGLGETAANLAYRAAVAYADATGWPSSFAIEVTKNIPSGAGLGGGSADAGAVLRALDALSPTPLGRRLVELAPGLGADVAFMTIDSPMALAWGRGERLLTLPALASRPVVLVMPSFHVATKDAYGWLAHDRGAYDARSAVLEPTELDTWEGIAAIAVNEFEAVVSRRHPEITACVDALRAAGALPAMMSGSGSAVFGVFADAESARTAAVALGRAVPTANARITEASTAERLERVETRS
jgi:4-diphosphocytidyl-2-C-methyl-D-erythritol kinase